MNSVFTGESSLVSILEPTTDGEIVVAGFTKFLHPAVGGVVAVDAVTGNTRWIAYFPPSPTEPFEGTNGRHTALWRNVVLASSRSGQILALNRETGEVLWSLPGAGTNTTTGTPQTGDSRAITVVGNTLYAGSLSGWFIAYDLLGRRERWGQGVSRRAGAKSEKLDARVACHENEKNS